MLTTKFNGTDVTLLLDFRMYFEKLEESLQIYYSALVKAKIMRNMLEIEMKTISKILLCLYLFFLCLLNFSGLHLSTTMMQLLYFADLKNDYRIAKNLRRKAINLELKKSE